MLSPGIGQMKTVEIWHLSSVSKVKSDTQTLSSYYHAKYMFSNCLYVIRFIRRDKANNIEAWDSVRGLHVQHRHSAAGLTAGKQKSDIGHMHSETLYDCLIMWYCSFCLVAWPHSIKWNYKLQNILERCPDSVREGTWWEEVTALWPFSKSHSILNTSNPLLFWSMVTNMFSVSTMLNGGLEGPRARAVAAHCPPPRYINTVNVINVTINDNIGWLLLLAYI